MARMPTPDELQRLAQCETINEAKAVFRASYPTIRYWLDECGGSLAQGNTSRPTNGSGVQRDPITKGELPRSNVWDIPEYASLDSGMWGTLEDLQQQIAKLDTEEDEITVRITDDKPVMITWVSDIHLGHTSTDMVKVREDFEAIKNNDGVYTILGGDLIDNVTTTVSGRGMLHETLTPIRVQKALIEDAVEYLGRENVIALILGNHELFSLNADDFDPIQYLAKKIGCSYLGAFGFINVEFHDHTHRILAAHQFRMRSSFHPLHQAKRLEDFIGDADVVFTGHTHQAGAETTMRKQQLKFYGQAGSYMTAGSRYSKNLGFPKTTPAMPGVILFPGDEDVIGVYDAFKHGMIQLRAFRSEY